tara:strand:- start:203 stop:532 length:330 start_codon:yes stop_codon:yes gene_type:complete
MLKFLKVVISGVDYLIPINEILQVEVGAATKVEILYKIKGHSATGASEVLGVELAASGADDASKLNEQLNSIVDGIEDALATAWSKPIYVLEPKYPITGFAKIEQEWSA